MEGMQYLRSFPCFGLDTPRISGGNLRERKASSLKESTDLWIPGSVPTLRQAGEDVDQSLQDPRLDFHHLTFKVWIKGFRLRICTNYLIDKLN